MGRFFPALLTECRQPRNAPQQPATAPDQAHLDAVLAGIAQRSGCPLRALPMVESFHIGLGFNLAVPRADRALLAAEFGAVCRQREELFSARILKKSGLRIGG